MNSPPINVIKASGETVPFSKDKLKASLERSGAPVETISYILKEIEQILYPSISTKEIYKTAFSLLHKISRFNAAKYKLKKAIMELGPTGYPFEKFIGEILKNQGYDVNVNVMVKGHCVTHEVDVVAQKDEKHFMIECKYHSSFSTKCNVKIPLYIQSRFLDIQKEWVNKNKHQHNFHQGWVVNNTRYSEDAIQYGNCAGLKLLSWDYPKKGSLKEQISVSGLYPITCLTSLKKSEKKFLLEQNIVLCKQLCNNPTILNQIIPNENRIKKILSDANELCKDRWDGIEQV